MKVQKGKALQLEDEEKLDLFNQPLPLPPQEKFPINRKRSTKVGDLVETDLKQSSEPYIITGFSSLGYLVKFLGDRDGWENLTKTRLAFGFKLKEKMGKPQKIDLLTFEEEAALLEEGFSVWNWSNLFRLIKLLENRVIEAHFLNRLHAKLYVGDKHATLGSSNFSKSGLTQQQEANFRAAKEGNEMEARQYESIRQLAIHFYESGEDCTNLLIQLLEQQLELTTWQETLARAIAELLERPWHQTVEELRTFLAKLDLWPTQAAGINQALQTLQDHHCVLIADPTGSGKTKMISTVCLVLTHWLWKRGLKFRSRIETVCPKLVIPYWEKEADTTGFVPRHAISDGAISSGTQENKAKAVDRLQKANILVIDEAHRFLNPDTARTRLLKSHRADFLILATATPLSKKPKDLIRLVELLGIDVLPDEQLAAFLELRKQMSNYSQQQLEKLREYLKHLLVRRTKSQINQYLLDNPVKHSNKKIDKYCSYPHQNDKVYHLACNQNDSAKAIAIQELAQDLNGVVFLQKLFKKRFRRKDQTDQQYLAKRLGAAKAIAHYKVRALLRSSRAALLEHVWGTAKAAKELDFKTSKPETGNLIQTIDDIKVDLPRHNLSIEALTNEKYSWLRDIAEYQKVCEKEKDIYEQIAQLAYHMSNEREKQKAKVLLKLCADNQRVIAFDSTLITLDYLYDQHLNMKGSMICHVPRDKASQDKVRLEFGFEIEPEGNHLALLSDSMSEGVNLPRARAVLMLDMPSVLRLAEQRIGRIDRLNSPFEEIEVWWPGDKSPFTLTKDLRLFKANNAARYLFGSNISVPEELLEGELEENDLPAEGADFMKAYREEETREAAQDAGADAYQQVRSLFASEGGLISPTDYAKMKGHKVKVRTKISIGVDESPWLFMAVRSYHELPPRWYLLRDITEGKLIETSLDSISAFLKDRLGAISDWYLPDKWREGWWDDIQVKVNDYLEYLQAHQVQYLPPQRKRALKKGREVLKCYADVKQGFSEKHQELAKELLQLLPDPEHTNSTKSDPYLCAAQWLDVLLPCLHDLKAKELELHPKSKKLLGLKDIKAKEVKLTEEELQQMIDQLPALNVAWENVAACMVAMPASYFK